MSEPDDPPDEPMIGASRPAPGRDDLEARIRELVTGQPYAVLCTQGSGQPYGSLIATGFTPDLRHVLFATPITTRKFRLLESSGGVAILVDDRPKWPEDLMRIQAVTVTGRAVRVEKGDDYERWADVLLGRHPHLESFVHADSCALMRVDALRYFHVQRFQEVREWAPAEYRAAAIIQPFAPDEDP